MLDSKNERSVCSGSEGMFFSETDPIVRGGAMSEDDHPKGALLLILVFLALLAAMWLNVYLHLWGKGWP